MNGPDDNEDLIFRVVATLIIAAGLLGLAFLLSGHGLVPPAPPTSQTTTASPTP